MQNYSKTVSSLVNFNMYMIKIKRCNDLVFIGPD